MSDEGAEVNRRPLTVMMVTYAKALGGAERSLLALATHLGERGINPLLVCPDGPLADRASGLGLTVARRPLSSPRRVSRRSSRGKGYSPTAIAARARNSVADARMLSRVVTEHGVDLLHSNSLPGHLPTVLAGRLARRPVVWHLREIVEPGPGSEALSLMGRLTRGMVAISDAVAASVRHPCVWTVYNPVPEPPLVVARPPWSLTKPLVGYLGRIDPSKGIEDLVVAAGLFGADVAIVGDLDAAQPDYVESLRILAASHAPERVHFLGAVDEPWGALAEFDVLVVPSLAEPFGRVAAEGQRAGVVVVAADAGGLPEIVTDGSDGLLYRSGDTGALATSIERVLADPALGERLRSEGTVTSQRFDLNRHADAMAEIFRECAGLDSRPFRSGGR